MRRRVLSPSQTVSIADKLDEPYATLVWFLAVTGLRIGEAIAIKWSDFEGDVLQVQRRVYDGKVDTSKSRDSNADSDSTRTRRAFESSGGNRRVDLPCTRWRASESGRCTEALHPPGGERAQDRLGWVARTAPQPNVLRTNPFASRDNPCTCAPESGGQGWQGQFQ
jgi:hypothetical protein